MQRKPQIKYFKLVIVRLWKHFNIEAKSSTWNNNIHINSYIRRNALYQIVYIVVYFKVNWPNLHYEGILIRFENCPAVLV